MKKMKTDIKNIILHILFFTGLFFLFFGGPGYNAPRSFANAWNLGHVLLFILFTFVLFKDWQWIKKRKLIIQWALILIAAFVLALSTEIAQLFFLRQFDWMDIFRDLSGCIIGMLLLNKIKISAQKTVFTIKFFVIILLVLITASPLFLSFIDEYTAYRQFPLLAGFETSLEIDRWKADGNIIISTSIAKTGKASLKIEFTTKKYSPVTLIHSLGKWEGFDSLKFSIYNPDSEPIRIVCRIHDNKHSLHDNAFNDRFNRSFSLKSGWNNKTIPLKDVLDTPKTRQMDMNKIEQISFFSIELPVPRIVYIDDVILVKNNN